MKALGIFLTVALLAVQGGLSLAGADLTHSLLGLQVTNYTGYVIDADANTTNALYNREHILAQSRVQTTNASGTATLAEQYLRFRLLNSAGQPHPLYDSTGLISPNGTYNLTNSFGVSARSAIIRTNVAPLRPATPLNSFDRYTVEASVYVPGAFTRADSLTNSPQSFNHFTNLVSNDPRLNVIAGVEDVAFSRGYAVQTDPDRNSFQAEIEYTLHRYDNFLAEAGPVDSVSVTLDYQLVNATTGLVVPLANNSTNFTLLLFKHYPPPATNPVAPWFLHGMRTVNVRPAPGSQLNSVDASYRLVVSISHLEQTGVPGSVRLGNTNSSAATRLLHFNGTLRFGDLDAHFTSIDNDPAPGLVMAGSHVLTTLSVDNQSGTIPGMPGVTFGDGTDFTVRLQANGDAVSHDDDLPLNLPPGGIANVNQVRMQLVAPAALTPGGLVSGLRVYLPTGVGYRYDRVGHILHRSFTVNGILLGKNLRPLSDVVFNPASALQIVDEGKPLWMETSSIVWRVAEGQFDWSPKPGRIAHVRKDEYARLAALHAQLENTERSLKRSNDRFYDAVQSSEGTIFARADANGIGRLTMALTLGSGHFQSHFPYDAYLEWSGPGTLAIVDDVVPPGGSQLTGVSPVALNYDTGCTGVECGPDATLRTVRLQPTGGILQFTRDGGLVAPGSLEPPHRLRWGYIDSLNAYAHESFTFEQGAFYMSGHFLRGDDLSLPSGYRAQALLLTGVAATNTIRIERPDAIGTVNRQRYEDGFADYAGINTAVGQDGTRQGHSVIAGTPTGNYQLKGISKYYARRGGVTGRHDAVPGTFPTSLTLYGYQFEFSNFGANFIGNQMRDSRIDGLIDIPRPSDFEQAFAGLRLNCLGGIEGAPMPEASSHPLAYWNGQFNAHALEFRRDPEEICNVTNAFLTMGVDTSIAHVQERLYGTLGFHPNGNLLPRAAGLANVDSRLKLPNVIRIAGPSNETYTLNPVLDVYFNGHDQLPDEPLSGGWVNIAGTLDVPFFEDLHVHVQTSANPTAPNAAIYMMGGWPDHGWEDAAGNSYFTAGYFDDVNRGYGGNVPADYRESQTDAYHPRAVRTWLGVIPFDYPLNWSSTTRTFRSRVPKVRDLLVLSTENELKNLTAKQAEIAFGAQFDGLPQFNLANIAYQALDAATEAADGYIAGHLVNMVAGFDRLDQILAADLDPFFEGVFDQAIQPKVNALAQLIQNANPDDWYNDVEDFAVAAFQTDGDSIAYQLTHLPQLGMVERLDDYLAQAAGAVDAIREILDKDPGDGKRHVASDLMRLLVQDMAAQFAGSFLDELVQPLLAEADPTLDQIESVLSQLHSALEQLRTALNGPAGMGTELQTLFNNHALEINALMPGMISRVGDFIGGIDVALDSPLEDFTPEEFTQEIRRQIEDGFRGAPVYGAIQIVHRQRLYDMDAAIRQATDTAFQQLNGVIRSVISETAEELTQNFTQFLEPLGSWAAAAKINGYAHINGDSLKEARLDLHTRLDFGSALEFNGYVQIKELDSQGSASCDYDGSKSVTEVSLGAEDVQVGWISPDLRASVYTKFTFDDAGDKFPLRGLGGGFELTGKLEYEAFAINFLGAAIALGAEENFLSGAAGMRVNKYDVFGGIYFGRACTMDPIRLWDHDAASLLGGNSFTGIYAYGEGWVPVNELIGIPASCLFNISAGLGMGAGVFLEGPTFVAKMTAGVSGEALCMVNIKGQLTGTASLEGLDLNVLDGLSVKAKGTVGGKFGPCPFCLEVEQSVALTFKQGKWKLDF
jgi:hypothetical protein